MGLPGLYYLLDSIEHFKSVCTIEKGETCKFDAKCSQFLVAPFGEICLMMYPKFKYLHRIALFGSFKNMNNNILIQQNHKLTYNVLLEE